MEGNNTANDWWDWEQAGKVKELSGVACDHYNRFREDFALIAGLGHNAHRFSIEWSRLEPEEGKWNEGAFEHYRQVFEELRRHKIEPVVTLHHFTNPHWFILLGGWFSPDSVRYFARYCEKVIQAFGKYARIWITLNEPMIYLYHGYFSGLWPPGLQSYDAALVVFRNKVKAHIAAYQVIHHYYETALKRPVWVSIAHHSMYFSPCRADSPQDKLAIFLRDWFVNHLFFDAVLSGFLFFPSIYCEFLPGKRALDFLGINYYSRDFIRFGGFHEGNTLGIICDKAHHKDKIAEVNSMGWEVYPEGLYQILKRVKRYGLPILITENGVCTNEDAQRERFIRNHAASVERAMQEGVPVHGYFYWSLMDNFEWAEGFAPRFGVVEINYATQERKVRKSAHVLGEVCRKFISGGS